MQQQSNRNTKHSYLHYESQTIHWFTFSFYHWIFSVGKSLMTLNSIIVQSQALSKADSTPDWMFKLVCSLKAHRSLQSWFWRPQVRFTHSDITSRLRYAWLKRRVFLGKYLSYPKLYLPVGVNMIEENVFCFKWGYIWTFLFFFSSLTDSANTSCLVSLNWDVASPSRMKRCNFQHVTVHGSWQGSCLCFLVSSKKFTKLKKSIHPSNFNCCLFLNLGSQWSARVSPRHQGQLSTSLQAEIYQMQIQQSMQHRESQDTVKN